MKTKSFTVSKKGFMLTFSLLIGLVSLFLPALILAEEPPRETLSGWLVVGIADIDEHESEYIYSLVDEEGQRVSLVSADETIFGKNGPTFGQPQYVTVSGIRTGSALQVETLETNPAKVPLAPSALSADITGSNPWIWILCKFADDNQEPSPLSYFQNLISDLNPYFEEASYNKANITGSNAVGWYTLPQNRSYYVSGNSVDFNRAATDCTAVADADVDFSNFYGLNLMFNGELGSSYGTTTWINLTLDGVSQFWPSVFIDNKGSYNMALTAHEMYHGFGLGHSSAYSGSTALGSWWDPVGVGACGFNNCTPSHIPAPQKDELGWIDSNKTYTATLDTQIVTLEALALPQTSNLLMVKIPLGGNRFYTLEARRPAGYDSKVPDATALIHEVNNPAFTNGHIGLIPVPGYPNPWSTGAMWTEGLQFVDNTNNITVTVISETVSGFQVQIDRLPAVNTILHVDADASGANNGLSWANAFSDLQDALAIANPTGIDTVQIWVAEGTYKPTVGADQTISFELKDGAPIYGGFAGTETSLSQRDISANPTILSGDLQGNDNDNIDAGEATRNDNSYHVVNSSNSSGILDGVIISGGNANGNDNDENKGGGIFNNNGNPTLRNVSVHQNTASSWGGGMYNNAGSPNIINSLFIENDSRYQGGGLANVFASASIINTTFSGNTASYYSNSEGGGILNYGSSSTIGNTIFWGNSDYVHGTDSKGQLFIRDGGTFDVSYSVIQGTSLYTGTGNLNQDPLFIGVTDFRLQDSSPAIDAGNNSAVPGNINIDLDGNTRFYDYPNPDTGAGTPPIVDMGPYEAGASSPPTNQAPYTPSNPSPSNGATGRSITPTLTWSGGDPDPGDAVTYTVALGDSSPPPTIGTTTATSYSPAALMTNTTYYWQITASDGLSMSTSNIWTFTTSWSGTGTLPLLRYVYLPLLLK